MKLASGLTVAIVTGGLLAVVACDKSPNGDQPGETRTTAAAVSAAQASCDMTAELGSCNEYVTGTTFSLEKSLCEGFKGRFSRASCPTSGQIGWCNLSDGEVKRYYGRAAKDRAYTAEEAKSDCESELVKGTYVRAKSAAD
jgi:hypothetical protein